MCITKHVILRERVIEPLRRKGRKVELFINHRGAETQRNDQPAYCMKDLEFMGKLVKQVG